MGFFSLLIAFLVEQARPLPHNNRIYQAIRKSAELADAWLHADVRRRYGFFGWLLVTGVWCAVTYAAWQAALWLIGPLGGLLSVAVLYLTVGFRQFSHYFTDIQLSLNQANYDRARQLLQEWKRQTDPYYSAARLHPTEMIRQAIEHALLTAHRHVFGVMFWYLLLPGPIGPVLYRVSDYLSRTWNQGPEHEGLVFGWAAQRIQVWLDWIPARLTALSFAAAGNFDEATLVWRSESHKDADPTRGVLLSAGLGALGLRPNYPLMPGDFSVYPSNNTPDSSTLAAVVSLIWRSVVLWMGIAMLVAVTGVFS